MARAKTTAAPEAKEADQDRNRAWREENQAALDAYAEGVIRDGLALARFRRF